MRLFVKLIKITHCQSGATEGLLCFQCITDYVWSGILFWLAADCQLTDVFCWISHEEQADAWTEAWETDIQLLRQMCLTDVFSFEFLNEKCGETWVRSTHEVCVMSSLWPCFPVTQRGSEWRHQCKTVAYDLNLCSIIFVHCYFIPI